MKGGGDRIHMAIQIILAIVIIIILYVITLVILNIDSLVSNRNIVVKPKEETQIIDGWADSTSLYNLNYNTINPFASNFRKIGKSINFRGGAQFTYQFWMKLEDTNPAYFENQVILLKGDNRKYRIGLYDMQEGSSTLNRKVNELGPDYMIKCPLIKFGKSYNEIIVEMNTNNVVSYQTSMNVNTTDDPGSKRNILSLLPLNWYLLSFVFEDDFSISESTENGIKITIYINDFPYHVQTAAADPIYLRNNVLKQNEGNLHILPTTSVTRANFIKLANIKYFNYALQPEDISKTYAMGPPNYAAKIVSKNESKPAFLTAFNKIDIYNY